MKFFIHEILPTHVHRAIFVYTDAFFTSDPLLLWRQFDTFTAATAIALPSHPEMFAPEWYDANKIYSCAILLDLERFCTLQLMDSTHYRALFGGPDPATGHFADAALGDQTFWWAIVSGRAELLKHLHYDWEVSSCPLEMYGTGLLGDELHAQLHTWATPHQGEAIIPKLVQF